jgi:hypothetical protein
MNQFTLVRDLSTPNASRGKMSAIFTHCTVWSQLVAVSTANVGVTTNITTPRPTSQRNGPIDTSCSFGSPLRRIRNEIRARAK